MFCFPNLEGVFYLTVQALENPTHLLENHYIFHKNQSFAFKDNSEEQ